MIKAVLTSMLLVSNCAFGSAQLSPVLDRVADQTKILQAISEVSHAYVDRNPVPFERVYLENYTGIREKPVFNMREQLIAMMEADAVIIRAGKKPAYETTYYESENPQFHFYGTTAILNIAKKHQWRYEKNKCVTTTQSTEVWIKRDGEWKAAAGHTSVFQCDAKFYYLPHTALNATPAVEKPPVNKDIEGERQIREILNSIVQARTSNDGSYDAVVDSHTSKNYVETDLNGEVVRDRSSIETLPALPSARRPGLRPKDDALVIYDNAAIYSYKVRSVTKTAQFETPRQCTIMFARTEGRWMIVAAHISRY